jgi:hypothetical protein
MSTYPSTNPRKRASAIKVSMTAQLHADLVQVAEAIGQTPATAASFAIGQWVAQQKRTLSAMDTAVTAMVETAAPEIRTAMATLAKSA